MPVHGPLLQATWSSFVFDYLARQKLSGSNMIYEVVRQLACPEPQAFDVPIAWLQSSLADFIRLRVLELAYTSYRVRPYAVDIVCGGARPAVPMDSLSDEHS